MDSTVLRRSVRYWIKKTGGADILVGIPSYNNAGTIGHVIAAVRAGLAKYFKGKRAVLIDSDGGSTDGTKEIVKETTVDFPSLLIPQRSAGPSALTVPYNGIPGKGSAFRTIFEIAREMDVKACAVVDSDLRSITPEWIELLLKPVLVDKYDYVAPLYKRYKYDGTITNSIVYPLTRALYGKRVRQPIGGEFGFSGGLARYFLTKDVWETDVARFGIDIWMTTTAIANNFRVCQAFLGAKIHNPKDPGTDLSAMLVQVVGSTFDLMQAYAEVWKTIKGSEPVPVFGFRYEVAVEPVHVNLERMLHMFRLGVSELREVWSRVLPSEILDFLEDAAKSERLHIPPEIWAKVVYSFAIAWHKEILPKKQLLGSLTPLYLGKTASFVIETEKSGPEEVEEKIEHLCQVFEREKTFLIKGWE